MTKAKNASAADESANYAAEYARWRGRPAQEVLAAAGGFGPSIIGQALFDVAKEVRKETNDGKFGPAIMGTGEVDITPWSEWSRAKMLELARKADLPGLKSNAPRDEVAEALVKAKIEPPTEA